MRVRISMNYSKSKIVYFTIKNNNGRYEAIYWFKLAKMSVCKRFGDQSFFGYWSIYSVVNYLVEPCQDGTSFRYPFSFIENIRIHEMERIDLIELLNDLYVSFGQIFDNIVLASYPLHIYIMA